MWGVLCGFQSTQVEGWGFQKNNKKPPLFFPFFPWSWNWSALKRHDTWPPGQNQTGYGIQRPWGSRYRIGGEEKKKKGQKTLPPVASYSLLNFLLFPHIHSTSFITPTASSPLCLKGLIVRSLAGTTKRLIGFSLLKHSTVCLRRRQPLAVWAYISH